MSKEDFRLIKGVDIISVPESSKDELVIETPKNIKNKIKIGTKRIVSEHVMDDKLKFFEETTDVFVTVGGASDLAFSAIEGATEKKGVVVPKININRIMGIAYQYIRDQGQNVNPDDSKSILNYYNWLTENPEAKQKVEELRYKLKGLNYTEPRITLFTDWNEDEKEMILTAVWILRRSLNKYGSIQTENNITRVNFKEMNSDSFNLKTAKTALSDEVKEGRFVIKKTSLIPYEDWLLRWSKNIASTLDLEITKKKEGRFYLEQLVYTVLYGVENAEDLGDEIVEQLKLTDPNYKAENPVLEIKRKFGLEEIAQLRESVRTEIRKTGSEVWN